MVRSLPCLSLLCVQGVRRKVASSVYELEVYPHHVPAIVTSLWVAVHARRAWLRYLIYVQLTVVMNGKKACQLTNGVEHRNYRVEPH